MNHDYLDWSELDAYRREPPAAPSGSRGKQGCVRLGFECNDKGRSLLRRWERRAPLIVQQALYFDREMPEMPCVYILSSGGPQVDGDRYEQQIELGPKAMAHIASGAATKIASMHHNFAAMHQRISLSEEAYLEYLPEPVIPCRRSRYLSITELEVAPSATLFWSEIYLPGRIHHQGECFAYDVLSLSTQLRNSEDRILFAEKSLLRPTQTPLFGLGGMHHYLIFANILIASPFAETFSQRIVPFRNADLALGVARIPNGEGVVCRILGMRTESVKQCVRRLCSELRRLVKGHPLPEEFPWR